MDPVGTVSVIKLKRTDTTLDLSHMAKESWGEKKKGEWGWGETVSYIHCRDGLCVG
jgi:hypothetical protein